MGVKTDENEMVKQSPILHLYPHDFKLDKNGKRMLWQAVVLLPFMDESELLSALRGLENQLTEAEKNRNTLGEDLIFVNTNHPLAPVLVMAQEQKPGIYPPSSLVR
jgi:5'-3' exoribonuclease 2